MRFGAEIIEVATLVQIEQVRSLMQAYQSGLPPHFRFPDLEWVNLPGDYAAPKGALLLATIDGVPVGCVGLRPFMLPGACEMKRLYVSPAFRGARLGTALVEQAILVAKRKGYIRLRLDTDTSTMQAAVQLYRRFGFQEIPAPPTPQVDGLSYMEMWLAGRPPV